MTECLCGSQQDYTLCCEPYHQYKQQPKTPEALMRSRYTAYCLADMDYIQKTMQGKALVGFDVLSAKRWAIRVTWIQLRVLETYFDSPIKGYVEFIASYVDGCVLKTIHEVSEFIQEQGRWYYVDGTQISTNASKVKQTISRNSLCPCGDQRKYKNCHGKS